MKFNRVITISAKSEIATEKVKSSIREVLDDEALKGLEQKNVYSKA